MLEIKNITKTYKNEHALQNVSMKFSKGMNFIIGSSGSGKTTLLKIISGIETEYTGDVTYCGKSIKTLTTKEKSNFYNTIYGFVWQDFHLLEELTVLENVLLPTYLKQNMHQKYAKTILTELEISEFANEKVKHLSGGQKQRVAIARELMKNPSVILADEPTSALDEESARIVMEILRTLAKQKTVLFVTHDTSLITPQDTVYELDKGELISTNDTKKLKSSKFQMNTVLKLSFKHAFTIAKTQIKHRLGRCAISISTLLIASVLLLTTCSGAIHANTQGEFDTLVKKYGDTLLDLSIIQSFTDASGTDNNNKKKPKGDVSQDIDGLYEAYSKDERVSHLLPIQAYENIKITLDGKQYKVESSGNSPVLNKVLSGRVPKGDKNEVLVPESFVKKVGLDKDSILGKEIDFSSSIYNWDSGEPISKNVNTKATIVGVIDTKATFESQGKVMEYNIDDSFFFTQSTIANMRKQADIKKADINFVMRAKTPSDLIHIKDELNKRGIVPLGQFELVEDMVRLQEQSSTQSTSASVMIAGLSFLMVVAIFWFTGYIRKQEYAIFKANGYDNRSLTLINFAETIYYGMASLLFGLLISPLLNMLTKSLFHVSILDMTSLCVLALLLAATSLLSCCINYVTYHKVNINLTLKSGGKS